MLYTNREKLFIDHRIIKRSIAEFVSSVLNNFCGLFKLKNSSVSSQKLDMTIGSCTLAVILCLSLTAMQIVFLCGFLKEDDLQWHSDLRNSRFGSVCYNIF